MRAYQGLFWELMKVKALELNSSSSHVHFRKFSKRIVPANLLYEKLLVGRKRHVMQCESWRRSLGVQDFGCEVTSVSVLQTRQSRASALRISLNEYCCCADLMHRV